MGAGVGDGLGTRFLEAADTERSGGESALDSQSEPACLAPSKLSFSWHLLAGHRSST